MPAGQACTTPLRKFAPPYEPLGVCKISLLSFRRGGADLKSSVVPHFRKSGPKKLEHGEAGFQRL